MAVKCMCTSQRQGDRPGSPMGAQELTRGFVHGICLLGGKSDVGHFPSREKNNNTRKRQALWECSKWEFQLSPEHKQRERQARRSGPASAEAESLGAGPLGPKRPCFEVTSLPSPGGNHRRQRHTSQVRHRKHRLGFSMTHSHSTDQS